MPILTAPAVPPGRLSAQPQPLLEGHGLVVRPWRPSDAPVDLHAYTDPAIQRWHVRSMVDADEAAAWIAERHERWQRGAGADWAVVADDAVVGRVGVNALDLHEGIGEPAYWVLPAARGRGTAVRALDLLTGWAFGTLGLHRLVLVHSTRNPASCRVAVRAGYADEGVELARGLHVDGRHDMHRHALVAP